MRPFNLYKSFLILSFVSILTLVSLAQNNISFSHLSSSDGLTSGAVISMYQDSKGYMWFGTYDGLNLYNGHEIITYTHDENDSTTISNSYINHIEEDKYGNFWIATNNGLNIYHRNTKTFSKISFDYSTQEDVSDAFNYILTILPDDSLLWVGTHAGLYKLNIKELIEKKKPGYIRHYFEMKSMDNAMRKQSSISFLYLDKDDTLWLRNFTNHLYKFDEANDTFINILEGGNKEKLLNPYSNIRIDNQGYFWIYHQNGNLSFFHPEKQLPSSPYKGLQGLFDGIKISSVIDVSDSTTWLATDGSGVYMYNLHSGEHHVKRASLADPGSLSSNKTCYLYKDKQGVIWIGTVSNGINIYNPKKSRFNHVYPLPCEEKYLSSKNIISITEDGAGQQYWLGTDGDGIIQFSPDNNSYAYNEKISKNLEIFEHSTVKGLFMDSKGILWILAFRKGLFTFDQSKGVVHQQVIKNANKLNEPWCITEDKNRNIWIGTLYSGLIYYNREKGEYFHFEFDPANDYSIAHNGILDVYVDSHNILWIGTYHGLNMADLNDPYFLANPNELLFKTFFHKKNENSLSSNRIQCISEGNEGEILIGTETGGVNIYDTREQKFVSITTSNGLPSNKVTGVSTDKKGRIWVTTNMGLSSIGKDLKVINTYNAEDGIQSNNCKFLYKTKKKHFFIGGNNGFNLFDPNRINIDTVSIDLYLTSVKVFGKEVVPGVPFNGRVLISDYTSNKKVPEFRYNENSIRFEYIAIDYLNPDKIKYSCELEGFDDSWKTSSKSRFSSYTNLPPGDYTFKIKSTNSEGFWMDKVVSFPFRINPPYWKTKMAYVFYFILISGLIAIGRHLTIKEIKIRNNLKLEQIERENERKVNQLKLAFFTNISHELRTPLTLISGPVSRLYEKALKNKWGDEVLQLFSLVSGNVQRLLELTNQLLDLRKMESGKMNSEPVKIVLADFLNQMAKNFEALALSRDIEFIYNSNIPENKVVLLDADKLNKILSNLLSNALKFTGKDGKVFLGIDYKEDSLKFEIRDTGIGIEKEFIPLIFDRFYQLKSKGGNKTQGTGIGLALTRDLVNLMKGKISVNSITGVGTSFIVNLPLQKLDDSSLQSSDDYKQFVQAPEKIMLYTDSLYYQYNPINESDDGVQKDTVLVIDDNPDMRQYICRFLSTKFSILEANNGKTGIEIALEKMPDIILSDIMMPDMDGIEMGILLKKDARTSHIPLILITALASVDKRIEGLKTGADDYITKPFNEAILLLKIQNLLKLRDNLKKFYQNEAGISVYDFQKSVDSESSAQMNRTDQEFIGKVKKIIEDNLDNPEFSVKVLARQVGMGNTQLFLKLKALIDVPPGNYIMNLRLENAKQYLLKRDFNVNEVAYKVGFSDPKYFTKCFKRYFGKVPSDYLKNS